MKKKLLFVFNPKSGKGLIKEHLVNIVDIMTKAASLRQLRIIFRERFLGRWLME